jgi:hypothetical protein
MPTTCVEKLSLVAKSSWRPIMLIKNSTYACGYLLSKYPALASICKKDEDGEPGEVGKDLRGKFGG